MKPATLAQLLLLLLVFPCSSAAFAQDNSSPGPSSPGPSSPGPSSPGPSGPRSANPTAAPNDAERIRILEARVAQLERTVDALLKLQNVPAQEVVPTPPADANSSALADVHAAPIAANPAAPPSDSAEAAPAPAAKPDPILIARARSQELLPSLGKIGAAAFLDGGTNSGPFTLHRGSYFGGGLSLPLAIVPGGRINYEVSVGLAQNNRRLPITSSVAQLINLTVLDTLYPNGGTANIQQAFTGTGSAPFAVTVPANWRAQTLQIVPLAARYDLTRWDRLHFRPYLALGLGAYVTVSNQVTTAGIRQNANLPPNVLSLLQTLFANNSPLSGALLGGQIATAAELKASGIPAGEGGLDVGMFGGGGIEWRPAGSFSIAIDNRYNYAPSGTAYNLTVSRIGWHF